MLISFLKLPFSILRSFGAWPIWLGFGILTVCNPLSARAEFFVVSRATTSSGLPAHRFQSWPTVQAFAANAPGHDYGLRAQGTEFEISQYTAQANGDIYTTAPNPYAAGEYLTFRWNDVQNLKDNLSVPIGTRHNGGDLVSATYDAAGKYHTVERVVNGNSPPSFTAKRYENIVDYLNNQNVTVLGTRNDPVEHSSIEFVDGRLISLAATTVNGQPAFQVWDWGTSFTGFISNSGTLLGTRTGSGDVVGAFSANHSAAQASPTVSRQPIWRWLGNKLPCSQPGANSAWSTENAFPNLTFQDPIQMVPRPASNQLWVIGREGHLWSFENNPNTAVKTLVLDLSAVTMGLEDCGLLGIAFHPQFGQAGNPNRGYVYLWHNYNPTGNASGLGANYNRLSRFTLADGASTIDPASEFVMINQFDEHSWHNGGGMFFGPDGFLYITNGDEGGSNDQYNNSQKLNGGLFSGVLRIDVDQNPATSHPIRRQPQAGGNPPNGWPATFSQGYYIPNDNPWLNVNGSILEEFWAIGLRSPHRMTRDPVTGTTFIGDIGQAQREEVDVLAKGANFQWAYREGDIAGPKSQPNPLTGTDTPPIWAYPRNQGDSAIIVGHVYRGPAHAAALGGKLLLGDFVSGRIWSMNWGVSPVQVQQLTSVTGSSLSGFGLDHSGEQYLMILGAQGKIFKLSTSIVPEPPATLSATGAFSDLATLAPAAGILPFSVNAPLWSDGTEKKRWIAVPNNGAPFAADELVSFQAASEWQFPVGTVCIKHFELPVNQNNPAILRRLETRFMVKAKEGNWYGVTYRWRPDGSDADLLSTSLTENISITTTGGGTVVQPWYYPSRTDCTTCHNTASSQVLGPRAWQLNGILSYPGTSTTGNQLQVWSDIGMFDQTLTTAQIAGFLKSAHIADTTASLEARSRSYMDSNCSHCHRPGTGVQAAMDFRFSTPLAQQNVINGPLNNTLGIPGAKEVVPGSIGQSMLHIRLASLDPAIKMPPMAKNVADAPALAVVAQWINSLAPAAAPHPFTATVNSYGAVSLAWTPQGTNQTGFIIERSLNGSVWNQIAAPAATAASHSDTAVSPNTTYHYRIAATSGGGNSPWSLTATATTWPVQGSWLDWQRLNPLGGQNGPLQNPDGDSASNLIEFLLGAIPSSGGSAQDHFFITTDGSGGITAILTVPNNVSGITFGLETAPAVTNPMIWSPVTIAPVVSPSPSGFLTFFYPGMHNIPALAASKLGVVRVKAVLGGAGETAASAAWFWHRRMFENGTRTFGPAMLKPERFSGTVSGGSIMLNLPASAGGIPIPSRFDPSKPAFVEVVSGAHEGHRFDINLSASGPACLALSPASPRNTQSPIPNLAGAAIIARDHWTLGEMFPPAEWQSGSSPQTADRVQLYNPAGGWIVYWLADLSGSPRWVLQGDASLSDQGGLIIAPGAGLFIRKAGITEEITIAGVLRPNAFALPSSAGATLVATGWPADQSPAQRAMLLANGFTGGRSQGTADQFLRWSPDLSPANSEGYQSHYLLNAAPLQYWTPAGNASLPDHDNTILFNRHTASFLKLKNAQPGWKLPRPWNP